jgi:hypothetical protein
MAMGRPRHWRLDVLVAGMPELADDAGVDGPEDRHRRVRHDDRQRDPQDPPVGDDRRGRGDHAASARAALAVAAADSDARLSRLAGEALALFPA